MEKFLNYLVELLILMNSTKYTSKDPFYWLDFMIVYYKKDLEEILLFYKKIKNSNYLAKKKFE